MEYSCIPLLQKTQPYGPAPLLAHRRSLVHLGIQLYFYREFNRWTPRAVTLGNVEPIDLMKELEQTLLDDLVGQKCDKYYCT